MSRSIKSHELQQIKLALKKFPDGASLAQVQEETGLQTGERTIHRRLKELVALGEVQVTGSARSTRYALTVQSLSTTTATTTVPANNLSLSTEANEMLTMVTRPLQQRTPVSYHRDFLENYEPNQTSYLSNDDKKKLAQIGQTGNTGLPAGTYDKDILNRLLIDLSWNSSRLEGNTYTLLDTERLLAGGMEAENKSSLEAQMILNHKDAIEFIINGATEIEINRYTILSLHALLSDNLLPDPAASGRLRNHPVGITKSVYTPLAIPQLIEEMFELVLTKAARVKDPFEQSFFLMVHLPYLQPFDDVNKRVSRLAANIPFVKHNLSPLSFIDVPRDVYVNGQLAVYEFNRVELMKEVYIWAYERSAARYASVRQSIGEPDQFRLRYRQVLRSVVSEIIKNALDSKTASGYIANYAEKIPASDRQKFIEIVETELLSLHDGNFARYYIQPSEFTKWKESWHINIL
jgi:Fic family protein